VKTVLVAGDFGRGIGGVLHPGHIDHLLKAAMLGDHLIVVTHPDDSIRHRKGYEPDRLAVRMRRIGSLLSRKGISHTITLAVDTDGTVAKTLELYRPAIFAKGGDRTPDNMPACEVEVCLRLGIEIRYGIGDLLGSSRELAKR